MSIELIFSLTEAVYGYLTRASDCLIRAADYLRINKQETSEPSTQAAKDPTAVFAKRVESTMEKCIEQRLILAEYADRASTDRTLTVNLFNSMYRNRRYRYFGELCRQIPKLVCSVAVMIHYHVKYLRVNTELEEETKILDRAIGSKKN